jgi:hypothetical protein
MVAAQGEGEEWKKNLTEGGRALQLDNEPADDQITKATLIDNSQPLKARSKSFCNGSWGQGVQESNLLFLH